MTVLPQRRDRLGQTFAGLGGDHDEHLTVGGHLEDQRRRHVVEQVNVVAEQDQLAIARQGAAGPRRPAISGFIRSANSGRRGASAPSGIAAAARVAATRAVTAPPASASFSASIANRVLPTPGWPTRTTPPPPVRRALAIRANSSCRPTNGQVRVTEQVSHPAPSLVSAEVEYRLLRTAGRTTRRLGDSEMSSGGAEQAKRSDGPDAPSSSSFGPARAG